MSLLEFLTVILFALILAGTFLVLWLLEKPLRDLNRKRAQAQYEFYHSAAFVFDHIANDMVSIDRTFYMLEEYCRKGSYLFDRIYDDLTHDD